MSDVEEAIRAKHEVIGLLNTNLDINKLIIRTKLKYDDLPDWIESWLQKKVTEIVRENDDLNDKIIKVYQRWNIHLLDCLLVTPNEIFEQHVKAFVVERLLD